MFPSEKKIISSSLPYLYFMRQASQSNAFLMSRSASVRGIPAIADVDVDADADAADEVDTAPGSWPVSLPV